MAICLRGGARSKRRFTRLLAASLLAISFPQSANAGDATPPAQIYTGGAILTMEGNEPSYVEALVAGDGLIQFTGPLSEAVARFPDAQVVDLNGKTMLPGFIDGHGHLYLTGFFHSMANVLPRPDGPGSDFDQLVEITRKWMETDTGRLFIQTFGWVLANGFDQSLLKEGTAPTAAVLDRITTDYPVLMLHQSGHVASLNSKGLEVAGYTSQTPDPLGGVIQRNADGTPNGVIEEAALNAVGNMILSRTNGAVDNWILDRGQEMYARYGFTTAEEARAFGNITTALARAAQQKKLKLDVIAYPDIVANAAAMDSAYFKSAYTDHYRIGGVKISLDGSPQAKTAWLTHPYHIRPLHTDAGYKGYPAMPQERAFALFDKAAERKWQIICHANGDAAIDQCLDSIEHAKGRHPNPDHRSVIIHAQTMRSDQIARMKVLRALPSYFTAHTFYWGDYHREAVLGSPRAERISPTRDTLEAGLTLTAHHDAPAILPDAMRVVDATVNRTTRSGKMLGPDQRLTAYEALKAITIWGAIQHFEEPIKGTLSPGKIADIVVLDANPLTVPTATIKDIRVIATIKNAAPIYCAERQRDSALCKTNTKIKQGE